MPYEVLRNFNLKVGKAPSRELLLFWRGELTQQEYLEQRIEVAMAHVRGRIANEAYEMIREMLFEMLACDPVLVAMKERLLWGK